MYHYTYLIQHKTQNHRYIGVRSSKLQPHEDTAYWGSSKYLPKDISSTHAKIILREWPTRKEALAHEILLHDLNDVANNAEYYNRAKQTALGFNTTGTTLTAEHKQKCSKALKGRIVTPEARNKIRDALTNRVISESSRKKNSESQKRLYDNGYVNPRQGIVMSAELKQKIAQRKKELECGIGTKNPRFTPWFIQTPEGDKQVFTDITKADKAVVDGFSYCYYQDLCTRSKGITPIKKGPFKGYLFGNIVEDIVSST